MNKKIIVSRDHADSLFGEDFTRKGMDVYIKNAIFVIAQIYQLNKQQEKVLFDILTCKKLPEAKLEISQRLKTNIVEYFIRFIENNKNVGILGRNKKDAIFATNLLNRFIELKMVSRTKVLSSISSETKANNPAAVASLMGYDKNTCDLIFKICSANESILLPRSISADIRDKIAPLVVPVLGRQLIALSDGHWQSGSNDFYTGGTNDTYVSGHRYYNAKAAKALGLFSYAQVNKYSEVIKALKEAAENNGEGQTGAYVINNFAEKARETLRKLGLNGFNSQKTVDSIGKVWYQPVP